MRPAIRLLGLAWLVALWAAGGAARAAGDEDTLRTLNEQYVQAGESNDKAWFARMLSEDFVCILSDGRVLDRAQFLALPSSSLASSRLDWVRVRVHGDTGIVHARYVWAMANGLSGVTVYTDVYVRRGRDWRVASAQLTREPPPR
jgi:Domain of unknown function (DUF4440)